MSIMDYELLVTDLFTQIDKQKKHPVSKCFS